MKFPTTFCVSLKSATERRQKVSNHLRDHGIEFHLFDAIHASKMGLKTKLAYLDDKPNWQPEDGPPYRISQPILGCSLSHYIIWRIAQYLPDDYFLIVEDDVQLCDGFKEKLMTTIQRLPEDWQFVFVGHCCLRNDYTVVRENIVYSSFAPLCTHAYLVKKSALAHIIETNERMYAPIDIQLQKRSLTTLAHYSLVPPLATQNGDQSTMSYA
jgi:GR25 family glycosyltransferase involved in LPS biosynthesis